MSRGNETANKLSEITAQFIKRPVCPWCKMELAFDEKPNPLGYGKTWKIPKWDGHENCKKSLDQDDAQRKEEAQRKKEREEVDRLIEVAFRDSHLNPKARTFDNFVVTEENEMLVSQLKNWIYSETGYLLLGLPGCGKSHLLCAVLTRVVENFQGVCMMIHLRRWLDAVLRGELDKSEALMRETETCFVLFIDDIGTSTLSDAAEEKLMRIFEYRADHKLPVFGTSNLSINEFKKSMSPRLLSRFRACVTPMMLKGQDRR